MKYVNKSIRKIKKRIRFNLYLRLSAKNKIGIKSASTKAINAARLPDIRTAKNTTTAENIIRNLFG